MSEGSNTVVIFMIIVAFVVGAVIGGVIGWYVKPKEESNNVKECENKNKRFVDRVMLSDTSSNNTSTYPTTDVNGNIVTVTKSSEI